MENLKSWGTAEKIVDAAMSDAATKAAIGTPGLSTVRHITDALRAAKMLDETGEREQLRWGIEDALRALDWAPDTHLIQGVRERLRAALRAEAEVLTPPVNGH